MAKPPSTWKNIERKIARFWGAERNPLSGSNSRQSSSDSLHKILYIETKYKKRHTILTLYRETEVKAKKEGKIPIICIAEKGKKGFWALIKDTDIERVITEKELIR